MKHLLAALLLVIAVTAGAAAQMTTPTILAPSDVKWTPASGPMAGTQMAVVYGDPSKAGPYVVLFKLPDGWKAPPHTHGDDENVTVLSGVALFGIGDKPDPAKMKELPAGSFVSVPKGVAHYAMAKGDSIIEVSGVGPSSMTVLKPK